MTMVSEVKDGDILRQARECENIGVHEMEKSRLSSFYKLLMENDIFLYIFWIINFLIEFSLLE